MNLKKKVESNTQVVIKKDKEETVIQKGAVAEQITKAAPSPFKSHKTEGLAVPQKRVGLAVGGTFNLGDYQSLRIDVWLDDYVDEESGDTVEKAYDRILQTVTEQLEYVRNSYTED